VAWHAETLGGNIGGVAQPLGRLQPASLVRSVVAGHIEEQLAGDVGDDAQQFRGLLPSSPKLSVVAWYIGKKLMADDLNAAPQLYVRLLLTSLLPGNASKSASYSICAARKASSSGSMGGRI